jgi:glucose/arabinose dehydrogenase
MALDERDLQPALAEPAGDDLAGRAGTDHDHVELSLAHSLSRPVGCNGVTGWHPDRMPRFSVVPLAAAFIFVSACGGSNAKLAAGHLHLVNVGSFDQPVYVTAPPHDTHRVFVVEQGGTIRVVKNGSKLATPFLDIRSRVVSGGEQGLLSMAFAPDYARSKRFWVYFTNRRGDEEIDEFRAASADRVDPRSARTTLIQPDHESNHNGGQLQFGRDGYLYAGLGDGGGANDQHGARGNAQNLGSLLGKIIRIRPRAGGGYSVPASNPFARRAGARAEVYSYGLRNPWRFSFDRRTGDLIIGDVGQNAVEEIDAVGPTTDHPAGWGDNFGWSAYEGNDRFNDDVPDPGNLIFPVWTYTHAEGCSISGGEVYRGTAIAGLQPAYVYSDYCGGKLWAFDLASGRNAVLAEGLNETASVRTGPDGELYVLQVSGSVSKIVPG